MSDFQLDIRKLENFLDGMKERLRNPNKLMQTIGETLVSSTKERLTKGESPDGSKMLPVKREGKKGKSAIPLNDTGVNLTKSITYSAGISDVTIGTNFEGGGVHQLGHTFKETVVTVKNRKKKDGTPVKEYQRKKPAFTVPARPYLGFSDDDKVEIAEHIGEFLKG